MASTRFTFHEKLVTWAPSAIILRLWVDKYTGVWIKKKGLGQPNNSYQVKRRIKNYKCNKNKRNYKISVWFFHELKQGVEMKATSLRVISLLFLSFLFISLESSLQSTTSPVNKILELKQLRTLILCRRIIQFEIDPETTNSAFTITTSSVRISRLICNVNNFLAIHTGGLRLSKQAKIYFLI